MENSLSSHVRWLFWHARQALATFLRVTLPSALRLVSFLRDGDLRTGPTLEVWLVVEVGGDDVDDSDSDCLR